MKNWKRLVFLVFLGSIFFFVLSFESAAAENDKSEVITYVLSSEASTELAGSFQTAASAYVKYSSSQFTGVDLYFFPVNKSDFYSTSGSLIFVPSVKYCLGTTANTPLSLSLGPSTSTMSTGWTGSAYSLYFAYGFDGVASFNYKDELYSFVSSNTLSLQPTSVSDSFSLLLNSFDGGSISYSGDTTIQNVGFSGNGVNKDSVTWSYDVSQNNSWFGLNPYYYLIGVDSGQEYGPFTYGQVYSLSDVSSWQTELFYIKNVAAVSSHVSATFNANTSSAYRLSLPSSTKTCSFYRNCTLSVVLSSLTVNVNVVFPGNKEVTDYLQEIIDGYDSSSQGDKNKEFADSQQQLQQAEDDLFSSASESFSSLDFSQYSLTRFVQMGDSLRFVSSFLQSVYIKMGDFGIIVTVGLVVMIASKIIGLYRFSTGGDKPGGE